MRKFVVFALTAVLFSGVQASWYWPFGSDTDAVDEKPKRVSELVEPASLLIEEASDLAAEGKTSEAVEKYRKALTELDRIELENPDRAKSVEFATIRNKRAYVNAAIDSLLLNQVKSNAKAVAVSDTTELEKRLADEKAEKTGKKVVTKAERKDKKKTVAKAEEPKPAAPKPSTPATLSKSSKSLTARDRVLVAISKNDWTTAERILGEMLVEKPNGAVALNLKAAMEARQGKLKEAEATLDQAILSNPRNHFAYYNMANLMLQVRADDKSVVKRYYETGRTLGGPVDAHLEEALK